MPRGDKKGPEGMGPMTGRKEGFCSGNDKAGYTVDGYRGAGGRGYNRGAGAGRCFNRGAGRGRGGYVGGIGAGRRFADSYQESGREEINGLKEEIKKLGEKLNKLIK